jgi:hypothetical protein
MKECEQIGDLFGELHDQELENEIEKAAREHLRNCPGCREEFKWYGITVHALTQLERVNPPEHFLDQLNVRLQTCSPTYSFRDSFRNLFSAFPLFPVPVGVTCLTLVVAVAWGVYSYTPPVSVPIGPTKTIAYAPTGSVAHADLTGSGALHTQGDTKREPMMVRIPEGTAPGATHEPTFRIARPHGMAKSLTPPPSALPASTNTIGSDNLTVESPSINMTVESLKKVLPNFQGTVVEEKAPDGKREAVLAVRIPPQSWPHLTTELINHGAVAVASTEDQAQPQAGSPDQSNVLIRIRIVNTR